MASSPIDIVKIFYGTFSLMGAEKAGHYLSHDFSLIGLSDTPLDKATWIAFLSALKDALPDFKIRIVKIAAEENVVRVTENGNGTHSRPMDMSVFGRPEIPASGIPVTFYPSEWLLTIVDHKISRVELLTPPSRESGLPGMLKAFAAMAAPEN